MYVFTEQVGSVNDGKSHKNFKEELIFILKIEEGRMCSIYTIIWLIIQNFQKIRLSIDIKDQDILHEN